MSNYPKLYLYLVFWSIHFLSGNTLGRISSTRRFILLSYNFTQPVNYRWVDRLFVVFFLPNRSLSRRYSVKNMKSRARSFLSSPEGTPVSSVYVKAQRLNELSTEKIFLEHTESTRGYINQPRDRELRIEDSRSADEWIVDYFCFLRFNVKYSK